ncbi:Lysine methyltransferase [Trema orientale]|uniref:Lysine methyltransferase n=1 Tax=Trema orientale TaxID=63057 RepID=A0A2P5EIX0_TREOI|nr:Lysine methyltransferase [Trema orientale]
MADEELNPAAPPCLYFFSALLAMEPTDTLIALARVCGKGSVSESVQSFIWSHCVSKVDRKFHAPYLKNFLKKLISEAERNCSTVLDEIYEQYAYYMTSLKDEILAGEIKRVNKYISFLFPEECFELSICPKSRKLLIPLQCSLNMLEGDTGCSVWPSSLYLSEFILSFPELFSNKSCFEVGSGVGLVGICLAHVKASKVVLSDGDMSTLANMKLNLELNHLSVETDVQKATEDPKKVKCFHLPWESVAGEQLQSFKPDIILGADVIYDPICLPHLVRVLSSLLNQTKSYSEKVNGNCQGSSLGSTCVDSNFNGANQEDDNDRNGDGFNFSPILRSIKGPLALMASVIRNIDTFNYFLALIDKASLTITDVTETLKPINLLPYMQSYNRSSIRLFIVSSK